MPKLRTRELVRGGPPDLSRGCVQGYVPSVPFSPSLSVRIRLLSCREHNMRRVLRGLVLRHRKSQRGQVNAAKKCLTLTEGNR